MTDKRIPVTEAAQRIVEAVEEVVSYELRGNSLRFNFDPPRRLYPSQITSSSATIFVVEQASILDCPFANARTIVAQSLGISRRAFQPHLALPDFWGILSTQFSNE